MKLIVIYGPPSVGKLTVASALAVSTGFKLFHNHLTINCVRSIFDKGSNSYVKLVGQIRLDIFEQAVLNKIKGLIFTFTYDNPWDNQFVDRMIEIIEKHNGEVMFVHLYCEEEELKKRIISEDRKIYNKLVDPEALKQYNLWSAIPHRKSLSIDNTKLAAEEVSKKIKLHYGL